MPLESKDIVAPTLALIGTLSVAAVGYRQWRRTQKSDFIKARAEAYKTAWEKMEQIHLYVRSNDYRKRRFDELLREVNVHLTQAGLYLDRGEKKRVNDYLEALRSLGLALADTNETDGTRKRIRATMHDTRAFTREELRQAHQAGAAFETVEKHREELINRFRKALGA